MGVLRNLVITSAGDVGQKPEQLKKWVDANGGRWAPRVQKGVTHLICSKDVWKRKGDAVVQAKNFGAIIVNYDWLEDSLQARRKLSETKYRWKAVRKERRKQKQVKRIEGPVDAMKFEKGCRAAREDTGSGRSQSPSDPGSGSRNSRRPTFFISALEELRKTREQRERNEANPMEETGGEHRDAGSMNAVIHGNTKELDEEQGKIDSCGIDEENDEGKEGEHDETETSSAGPRSLSPQRSTSPAGSRSLSISSPREPCPAPSPSPLEPTAIASPPPSPQNPSNRKTNPRPKVKKSLPTGPSSNISSSPSRTGLPSFVASTANPTSITSPSGPRSIRTSPALSATTAPSPTPQTQIPKTEKLTDNHHIYLDNAGLNHDILLIRTNLYQNSHAKYSLKLFESNTKPHTYCVFVRYEPNPPRPDDEKVSVNAMGVPIFKPTAPLNPINAYDVPQANPQVIVNARGVPIYKSAAPIPTTTSHNLQYPNTAGNETQEEQHPSFTAAKALICQLPTPSTSTSTIAPAQTPPTNQRFKALIVPLNTPFPQAFHAFRKIFETLTFLSWDQRQLPHSKTLQVQRARILNREPFMYVQPEVGMPIGVLPPIPLAPQQQQQLLLDGGAVEEKEVVKFENEYGLPGMDVPLSRESTIGSRYFRDRDELAIMEQQRRQEEDERVRREMEMKHQKRKKDGKVGKGGKGKERGRDDGAAVFLGFKGDRFPTIERRFGGKPRFGD